MKLEGRDADNEGRGAGEARKLREKLNNFIKWANDRREKVYNDKPTDDEKKKPPSAATKRPFKNLCIDPVEDPTVPQNSEMKKKPWEYYTFHGAPAIANIALLQKYKTDIRFIEADMLEFLKGRITDRPLFSINKLDVVIAPESNRVLAGMAFNASVYVVMSLKGPADKAPRFSATGLKINPDPKDKSKGKATVLANAANIRPGQADGTQSYSVKVQVAQSDGTWKSLDAKGTFTVVKPDLEIGSMKLNPLYKDCANEVEARSIALGTRFNPKFKAVGGEAQGHPKEKNKVRLFPTGKTFKLIVSNDFDGQIVEIGSKDFVVKDPPAPDIVIKVAGKDWNPSMKIGAADEVKIICKAEPNFYDALPKDARYKIEKVNVYRRCGITPREPAGLQVAPSDASHNATVTVRLGKADLQKGCNVFFEVEKISRVNYQDKLIDVTNQLTAIQRNIMGRID
jgi:gliding motility-associated protein GldM